MFAKRIGLYYEFEKKVNGVKLKALDYMEGKREESKL